MDLNAVTKDKSSVTLTDYVESIENEVSEIKFFLSQIYKAFTIYKDKKEEFKAEVQKLNEIIDNFKVRESKYTHEIENLNKTLQSLQEKEKKYNEQIKQLENRLIEKTEKTMAPPRNRKNQQQFQPNVPQVSSPDVFYEKRPYYNELNVSKVINPFQNFRTVN
jgi:chromosome segregation ATPase